MPFPTASLVTARETFLFIYFFPCGKVCFSLAPGNNRSVSGMLFLSRPGSAAPGPRLAPRTRAWGPTSSHTHSSASARGRCEASLTTSYDGLLRLRVTLTSGPGLYSQKRYTVRGGGPCPALARPPPSGAPHRRPQRRRPRRTCYLVLGGEQERLCRRSRFRLFGKICAKERGERALFMLIMGGAGASP